MLKGPAMLLTIQLMTRPAGGLAIVLAMVGGVQAACFNCKRRLAVATAAEFVTNPKQLPEEYVHGAHGVGQHFSR
jgi:hypothetical protein